MGGREGKTWVVVSGDHVRTKKRLRMWIERAVAFAATVSDEEN